MVEIQAKWYFIWEKEVPGSRWVSEHLAEFKLSSFPYCVWIHTSISAES